MIEFLELAKVCAPEVHATTIAAIVRHESGFDPLAIGVNEKPHRSIRPTSRDQAITEVKALLEAGKSFDAGYGQINNKNWEWLGITPENVFDPCTNLRAAQRVLVQCYEGASKKLEGPNALYAALSCYNTGNYRNGLTNGYVDKVVAGAKPADNVKVPALPSAGQQSGKPITVTAATNTSTTSPARQRSDAFSGGPTPDAFHKPSTDAFNHPYRASVGSIIYHGRP